MKTLIFARRNAKEILRDPLSYAFGLAMPLCLMVLMNLVFYAPESAFWFAPDLLTPGIIVFSYAFTMLYMAMLVSKDKSSAFLTRMFSAPMGSFEYILGYALPGLCLTIAQGICCGAAGVILGAATGMPLSAPRMLFAVLSTLPVMLVYVGFGILFGTLFNEKSAPGACSIIISAGGMLCGAWMPVETFEMSAKGFYAVCRLLPFYPATVTARCALGLSDATVSSFTAMGIPLYAANAPLYGILINLAYACVVAALASLCFRGRMKNDK